MKTKRLFSFLTFIIFLSSFIYMDINFSYAEIFSNLSPDEQKKIIAEKRLKEQNSDDNKLSVMSKGGNFSNAKISGMILISDLVQGNVGFNKFVFEKDLILTSEKINNIHFKNTVIKGDLYIINSNSNMNINLQNTSVGNIFINSPVSIKQSGKQSSIKDIVISKDFPTNSKLKINANAKKLINNAQGVNLEFNGNIDKLVSNKKLNLFGKNSYKIESNNDESYFDTFLFDLAHISNEKNYTNLNEKSSYSDLYKLVKKEQYLGNEKVKIIVKNMSKSSIQSINDIILKKFNQYVFTHSSGIYTTWFQDDQSGYGVINIYFIYDADRNKIRESEMAINKIYSNIKHLDGEEYIKEVNKILALNTVYDNSLSKHSLYDAVIKNTAVCDGYSKAGYELLQKKFGEENTMLISNEDHMWNLVKLDGRWYHIDFTHNDPVTNPHNPEHYTEDFLLLSDKTLKEKSNGRTWDPNVYPKAE